MSNRIFVGVDAGGTKVRAAVLDAVTGRAVRLMGPGANAAVEGPVAAAERILDVLSGCSGIRSMTVGLAGAWSGTVRARVARIIRRRLAPDRLAVLNDAEAVLMALAPSENAILLTVGTGAVAMGRDRTGRMVRADGWGPLAGDAGSGYWIGRRALEAALSARDGRGPATSLTGPVLRAAGITRPEENIHRLYSAPAGSARIAALAPLVLASAKRGDRVARGIVRDAAAALAVSVRSVIRRLPGARARIFCAGGLAAVAPELLAGVHSLARARGSRLENLPAVSEIACLNLALRADGLEARFGRILNRLGPASRPGNREGNLPVTERVNPAASGFSRLSPLGMVRVMNREDARVAPAVGALSARVARAVSLVERALRRGGRLIYVGAGTSGRLGILDASEAPPTFGVRPGTVIGLIAGGPGAVTRSIEGAEDNDRAGKADIGRLRVGPRDAVIALSAGGGAPYVLAAVSEARRRGAGTVGITVNPGSRLARAVSIALVPRVGPEVVAGSTRLKAGTAQKLLLNMISTCAFASIGRVSGNVMTHLTPVNEKLRDRAVRIASVKLGVKPGKARRMLESLDWNLPSVLATKRISLSKET